MIQSPYQKDFDIIKVVFFMETVPGTDKFEQIMLNEETYKKVLKFLGEQMEPCPCPEHPEDPKHNGFVIVTEEDVTATFPNIKAHYTDEEINKE